MIIESVGVWQTPDDARAMAKELGLPFDGGKGDKLQKLLESDLPYARHVFLQVAWLIGLVVWGCGIGWGQPTPTTTVYQKIADNLETTPSFTDTVKNVGQTGHLFIGFPEDNPPNVCNTGTFAAVPPVIRVEGSYDGVRFATVGNTGLMMPESAVSTAFGTMYFFITGNAPFPYIRLRVQQFNTADCQLDIYYSGGQFEGIVTNNLRRYETTGIGDGYGNAFVGLPVSWDANASMQASALLNFNGDNSQGTGYGGWDKFLDCAHSVVVNVGAATTVEVVAPVADQTIHVCSVDVSLAAAGTVQLVSGTGANCAVGTTSLIGAMTLGQGIPLKLGGNLGRLMKTGDSEALCVVTTGVGATAQGIITYGQYITDQSQF